MDIVVGVIVGLFVLMTLVVLHEFGHFVAARRNGVHVLEFGIGFPPRAIAWVRRNGKWVYLRHSEWAKLRDDPPKFANHKKPKFIEDGLIFSLNFLPIGGFCQMDGESAEDSRAGTFGHASYWQKTKILFAGVAMNWLTAFVILTILAWTGMPTFLENQFTIAGDTKIDQKPVEISEVVADSPASLAGLQVGDQILSVDGQAMWTASEIIDYNETHAGEEVTYTILRESPNTNCENSPEAIDAATNCKTGTLCETLSGANCEPTTFNQAIKLNDQDAEYLLGIAMSTTPSRSYSTWSAPLVGAGLTLQMTGETYQGLAQMVASLISGAVKQLSFNDETRESGRAEISKVGDSVSGPVGIVGVLFPAFTASGPTTIAFLAALISISLACMNVLPIPALDGGRWFLITLYKIRRKKLTKAIEEKIVVRAFMVLFALMIIVTILDIMRFF